MPWITERVEAQLNKCTLGRTVLDGIIREVVAKRSDAFAKLEEAVRSSHTTPAPQATPVQAPATEQTPTEDTEPTPEVNITL